jgi:voltage-gated potassium channel
MEDDKHQQLCDARTTVMEELQSWLEIPMLVLAFVWLALFVAEVIWGLTPFLEAVGTVVWVIFLLDFAIGFLLAPVKLAFLRRNWLSAIALLAPALRIFRLARVFRLTRAAQLSGASRGLRLLRFFSSINRGMKALGASMRRRGFGYVSLLTLIITLVGAAGMYAFENEGPAGQRLATYSDALWWTAMVMTTMGSDYWPHTGAGRVLCVFLSLYSLAVLGYIAAALSTFFIGRDAEHQQGEIAGNRSIDELRREISALRAELHELRNQHDIGAAGNSGPRE